VFWVRSASDYEKPRVDYTHQLYAEFLFEDTVTGKTTAYQYCTVRSVHDVLPNPLPPPSIESTHYDYDRDGFYDQFNMTIRLRSPEQQSGSSRQGMVLQ